MVAQRYADRVADDFKLTISHLALECTFSVPECLRFYSLRTKEEFGSHILASSPCSFGGPTCSEPELLSHYIHFLITNHDDRTRILRECDIDLVKIALKELREKYMLGIGIHRFAANLSCEERGKSAVIRAYYEALRSTNDLSESRGPSLFTKKGTSIYAIFGGQGNTEHYFDELRSLYDTHSPILDLLLHRIALVLNTLASESTEDHLYCHGIDFLSWLRNPIATPSAQYLLSASISFPLIGLTQLLHYYVLCQLLRMEPGELLGHFKGMTGHSQGIVVATAVAAADTMQDFEDAAVKAVQILFCIGHRSQQMFPELRTESEDENSPSPMMNVTRLSRDQLQLQIDLINSHLTEGAKVEIALINGRRNFVVGGPPSSLVGLKAHLQALKAPEGLDQSRILFTQRKVEIVTRFLPVTVPFHSSYLKDAASYIDKDLQLHGVTLKSSDLMTSVYHTGTGEDLATLPSADLVPRLVRMITEEKVDWPKATVLPGATHILDFGPGGPSGVGALQSRNKEGEGARVILVTVLSGTSSELRYRPEIFDFGKLEHIPADWARDHGPRLVKNASGKMMVDTAFSRLLGVPPVMIAGMTPTTVSTDFVAASINAGYHVELASGGYFDADSLTKAVGELQASIPIGRGITINLIYSNPRGIQWQILCIQKLQATGHNIEGVTFGAGVPSVEIATEYIKTLGLKHISFKPGSVDAIKQVLAIARMNPAFPVLLQWTGGRGGGHHSYEDFHDPILETYGRIRKSKNIVLVAGSGFGSSEDTWPYLTGTWSSGYGYPSMPFDGCLLGSRIMIAKEALTSHAAKQLIARVDGLCDERWHETYNSKGAGGIITVTSEMGQPIHKIATRGVQLWAELDRTIFSLEKKQQLMELAKKRDYIIGRLNRDFQKVWFGGSRGLDLRQMKYAEVLERLVELLYVKHQSRWIDQSYIRLVADFIKRLEERLSDSTMANGYSDYQLHLPFQTIQGVLRDYPSAARQLITAEDEQYLLSLFRRRNQKPVPFIPVLDVNFETYFKKDSLWQSEDVDAVVDQDVQRTCILHGPVAAQHSNTCNIDQPVKVILDGIHEGHINNLLGELYDDSVDAVPFVEYFGRDCVKDDIGAHNVIEVHGKDKLTYTLPSPGDAELPNKESWLRLLAGDRKCWRHALFASDKIVQGLALVANPIQRMFTPRHDLCVEISSESGKMTSIIMKDTRCRTPVITIEMDMAGLIQVSIHGAKSASGGLTTLNLSFSYQPTSPGALIHEVMLDRNEKIKAFYRQIWVGNNVEKEVFGDLSTSVLTGEPFRVDDSTIKEFVHAMGSTNAKSVHSPGRVLKAPLDFGIVIAWKAIMKALLLVDGDLLRLVHLTNKFNVLDNSIGFEAGRDYGSTSKISAVVIQESGKMVEICASITHKNTPVMEITSQFLFRDEYKDFSEAFQLIEEPDIHFTPSSAFQVALLMSKNWWEANGQYPHPALLGCDLTFQLKSFVTWDVENSAKNVHTTGRVLIKKPTTRELVEVATVDCKSTGSFSESSSITPVIDFLHRHGASNTDESPVKASSSVPQGSGIGTKSFIAPDSNAEYAQVSKDFNPIHVSDTFAQYADLPGPITHGMYTSALVRGICETGSSSSGQMKSFRASFCGMVQPGDVIDVDMQHIAMRKGRKVFTVEARNKVSKEKVLVGQLEVEEADTAYFFTGQGSQELKMGMDLYETSPKAREIWDRADDHFFRTYGFKISHIVKENPKKLTVHFGGRRGAEIRQNYLRMTYEHQAEDGSKSTRNFFGIDANSRSYTYHSPTGLLNSTEFTQPALAIMEKAIYDDMISANVFVHGSKFAGHSLGEYSALATIANIMPLERLLSVVFYRGLSMRVSVPRDSFGRSNYGMMAISPQRISKNFSVEDLHKLIHLIQSETKSLLEIVNYNVELSQYVCAGSLQSLEILNRISNHLHAHPQSLTSLPPIVAAEIASLNARRKEEHIVLKRGKATVPLPGIDVPFHSQFLLPYLPAFREVLLRNIDQASIDPGKLVGQYVPNVTARPFEITKEAFEYAFEVTGSERLGRVLDEWEMLYAAAAAAPVEN